MGPHISDIKQPETYGSVAFRSGEISAYAVMNTGARIMFNPSLDTKGPVRPLLLSTPSHFIAGFTLIRILDPRHGPFRKTSACPRCPAPSVPL